MLVRVSVLVWRPNAVDILLDGYSHGVVHDFDKYNATEKAPEENVGEGDADQIEALEAPLEGLLLTVSLDGCVILFYVCVCVRVFVCVSSG